MKARRATLIVLLVSSLLSPLLHAQETLSRSINYQAVLRDDSGNLIKEPWMDLEFRVVDGNGNQLYIEKQPQVQVIRGTVNVHIGEGIVPGSEPAVPTGGIPLEAFDLQTGPKYLEVKIGENLWKDPMELVMVPTSVWAEKALSIIPNSINSEHIINGSIKIEDLAPELNFGHLNGQIALSQIPQEVTTDQELQAHVQASEAHKATQVIAVEDSVIVKKGMSVEWVLHEIDKLLVGVNNIDLRISKRIYGQVSSDAFRQDLRSF